MAKWGEGDPRWIVEERADATNVNNWHWTEKNATAWSKDKIKELLTGFKVESDEGSCEITEVSKCEGEASANNRKAKLIFFYEWHVKCEWSGKLADGKTKFKGAIEIPNLSDENEPSELDVQISIKSDKDDAYKVKEIMRKKGTELIQMQLGMYILALKKEYSQGMILPTNTATNSKAPVNTKNVAKEIISQPVTGKTASVGVKIHTKTLKDKQEFKCEASDLYRALTERDMVMAFTRDSVDMEAEKGGRFVLFGGNINGSFVELNAPEKIVMRWRFKTWPDEHYSEVTIDIKQQEDNTLLSLTQTGIPDQEFERTKDGWLIYYWDSIRQTFGFGSRLF